MADDSQRAGRPRDASIDDAVRSAVLELLGDGGIAGLSMELVAKRAGVGKAAIYRRWSSKEALVVDALGAQSPFAVPNTGSLRGDIGEYIALLVELARTYNTNDVLPHLIAAACYDERLSESLHDYMRSRQHVLRTILQRAVDRGELPADLNSDQLVELMLGAYFYRRLLTGDTITEASLGPTITFLIDAAQASARTDLR